MNKNIFFLFLLFGTYFNVFAEDKLNTKIIPTLGGVEHKEATVIFQSNEKMVEVSLRKKGNKEVNQFILKPIDEFGGIYKHTFQNLEMGTVYEYKIGKTEKSFDFSFTTKSIWEHRRPAPNFSFIFGSCIYNNDSLYDRPGKPYGGSRDIFKSMMKDTADFYLWTGDNHYYRESDFTSKSALYYRFKKDRSSPDIAEMMSKKPNYAIWDDHDYGPNDANSSYKFKDITLHLFKNYWGNPVYGNAEGKGIYGNFQNSDVEFFLMDDRYFRSGENYPDSINGKPNAEKKYWGNEQMEWLKNALLSSNATFKIIVNGNQVLNKNIVIGESFVHYSSEYQDFTSFLAMSKIPGVLFISGDRHFSEILKIDGVTKYPLYEITCSPITSGAYKGLKESKEGGNPLRVEGSLIMAQNYGLIKVEGENKKRNLIIELKDINGNVLLYKKISQNDLK